MARSTVTAPFVAREAQLDALVAALERAAAGQPSAVLVGADAGVGKTRLLTRLAELASARGATVAVSHCVDLGEVGLPYLPFAEALTQLRVTHPAVDTLAATRPELARLLPSTVADTDPPSNEQAVRLQLFDGIAAVLRSVGEPGAPLVLVLEDLHWADSSSRDVLRFLIARMRAEHLLVVASYRTDDLHRRHPLRPMLAELWRHPRVERLDLPAFTDEEMRRFTTAVLGHAPPEPLLRRVTERSEGNAYFAEELLERGSDGTDLPWALADVLRSRLEHLDPAVQRLAGVASVAGRRVTEPLLRAVVAAEHGTDLDPLRLDDVLREAVAHHVLVGEDGHIAFRHALLAEVVYADLLPGEQAALHRTYLRVMTEDPSLGAPSTVAAHALKAHDVAAALGASHAAARDAAVVLAPQEELRHLETVLRLWEAVPDAAALVGEDRIALLTRAATAASRAGEPERAVALAREAVHAAEHDTTRQARLRARLARHLLSAERDDEAITESARALADLPVDAPAVDRAWVLSTHAHAALWQDLDDEATSTATEAIRTARAGDVPAAEADALATLAVLVVDDPDRAAHLLSTARQRAADAGDVVTEQRCAYNLATTLYYAGRLDEAASALDAGLARTRAAGLSWSDFGVSQRFFAELVRFVRGDLSVGDHVADAVPSAQMELLATVELYAAVARGDGHELVERRLETAKWSPDGQIALIAGGCTIDALTWAGELDAAVELADDLLEHLGRTWSDYFLGGIWLSALALAALADGAAIERLAGIDPEAKVRRGDALLERAVTTAERGRPRGGRLGPEGRAWLARARAEHARLTGNHDPVRWQEATEAFGYGYRYEEARSRWRWAEALLASGDRVRAQEQLARAAADAVAMGAVPLTSALESLARRGRLDLPGLRRPATELLTAREAEVLTLVAQGLSNRQIGERLFISGKTVSVHVSNLLTKLGVSGRAQAVSVAHGRGLLGGGPP